MGTFSAINKNIFVKEVEQENVVGDFVIPDSVNIDFTIGEIVSIDAGYYENGIYVPHNLVIGDVIAFPKVAGTKVTLDNEKFIRVMSTDVVAVRR